MLRAFRGILAISVTLLPAISSRAQNTPPAITVLQSISIHSDNVPVVISLPASPAVHDVLVVGCSYYIGTSVAAPDSTWIQAVTGQAGTVVNTVWTHAVGSGETNSYSFTNDNHTTCQVYDLAGAAYYGPVNQAATTGTTAANVSSQTTPAVTPTVAGTLPLAFFAGDDDSAPSISAPWTFLGSSGGPHWAASGYAPLTTDTTTPQSATFSISGANVQGIVVSTLLIAPYNPVPFAPVANAGGGYSGIVGLPVTFDGSASYDPKLETLTYSWSFGDGGTSNLVKPVHIYTTVGTFAASLTVTNADGLTSTANVTVTVTSPASSGITVVQSVSVHVDNVPVVVSLPASPAVHDVLVVGCSYYVGTSVAAPNSTWIQAVTGNAGTVVNTVWTHAVGSGETNSYTFTNDNHTTCQVYDLAGASYSAPVNQAATFGTTAANVSSQTTPAVTPTVAGTLPLAFFAGDDDSAPSITAPWTFLASSGGPHWAASGYAPLTTDTTTPQSATFSISGANVQGIVVSTLLIAPIIPPPPTITVVQSVSVHSDNVPVVVSLPASPAVHDLLVVGCSYYVGTSVTVPDSTWIQAVTGNAGTVVNTVWTHAVGSGETNSYTFTNDNHTTCQVYDLAGASYSAPVNQAATFGTTAANVSSQTTPAVTPTVAGTLPLAFFAGDDDSAPSVTAPWTFLGSSGGPHWAASGYAPLTTDTTTPQSATFSVSGANVQGIVVSTLLIAP